MNRGDRRRQSKDDQRAIAKGVDIAGRRADQICALMRVLHGHVVESQRRGSLSRLFEFAFDNLGQTNRAAPKITLACSKGCSHCCHMWVSVSAPEALNLASRLRRENRDLEAVLRASAVTKGMTFDERGQFVSPCPLLGPAGACTVYTDRPITCRTATSTDAELCRRAYLDLSPEEIPQSMYHMTQRAVYAIALKGAFKREGLSTAAYELNEVLSVALETPDAEARWLAGDDIFAGVQQDPNGDPFDQRHNLDLYLHAFA